MLCIIEDSVLPPTDELASNLPKPGRGALSANNHIGLLGAGPTSACVHPGQRSIDNHNQCSKRRYDTLRPHVEDYITTKAGRKEGKEGRRAREEGGTEGEHALRDACTVARQAAGGAPFWYSTRRRGGGGGGGLGLELRPRDPYLQLYYNPYRFMISQSTY